MRWMWIDQIVSHARGERLVAVKCISLSEEMLHDHIPLSSMPEGSALIMPASLLIEGMAQTAGILVGYLSDFREKVILGKINLAEFDGEVFPGQTVRFDARIDRTDPTGVATTGIVEVLDQRRGEWRTIGRTEMLFSHLDQNRAGVTFPEHNFVFSENFQMLLADFEAAEKASG